MANSEMLDDFIGEKVFPQFEQLHVYIKTATEDMVGLTDAALEAFKAFGNTGALLQLVTLTDKAAAINANTTKTVQELSTKYVEFTKNIQGVTDSIKNNVIGLVSAKDEIKGYKDNLAAASEWLKKGKITQAEYNQMVLDTTESISLATADMKDYTASINAEIKAKNLSSEATIQLTAETIANRLQVSAVNGELKKNLELQNAVAGSIAEARIQSTIYRSELENLNLTTEAGVQRQKELITLIAERDAYVKNNVDAYSAQKINIGNYPSLTAELTQLKLQMQQLALAGEKDGEEFEKLSIRARQLTAAMSETNNSIKEATSVGDRFVNIVERMGLRLVANLIIFQAAMELYTEFSKRADDEFKRSNAVQQAAIDINTKAGDTFSETAAKMEGYRARFLDTAATIDDKKEVVKDLNRDFEQQIGHINGINDAEKFFIDKSAAFIQATMLRSQALGALGVVQDKTKENITNQASGGAGLVDNFDAVFASINPFADAAQRGINLAATATKKLKEETDANNKAIDFAINKYKEFSDAAKKIDKANGFDTDPSGSTKKPVDSAKNNSDELFAAQKKYYDAVSELQKNQYNEDIINQKRIIDSNRATANERVQSAYKMHEDIYQISKNDNERQILDSTIELNKFNTQLSENNRQQTRLKSDFEKGLLNTTNENYAIELKNLQNKNQAIVFQQEALGIKIGGLEQAAGIIRQKNVEDTAKEIIAIQKDEVSKRTDAIKELNNNIDLQQQQAIAIIDKGLKDETMKYSEYTLKKKQIEDDFAIKRQKGIIDYLDDEIKKLEEHNIDVTALVAALNSAKAKLYAADSKNDQDNAKIKEDTQNKLNDEIWKAATQGITTAKSLVDDYYQNQLSYQQKVLDNINQQKTAQADAINSSFESEQKKKEQIQVLDNQYAIKQKQVQDEMSRIKRQQAIADKAASLLNIAEQTAIAEVSALKLLTNPVTAPFYPAMAALIAGIGAAQVAAVIAAPIPQYAKGTPSGGHPFSGPALIGEEYKPELVIEPGKAPYFVDSPTVKNLPALTRVIPQADLINGSSDIANDFNAQAIAMSIEFNRGIENIIGEKMEVVSGKLDEVVETIKNKKETYFHWNNGELRKSVKNGRSWTDYLNNSF